MINTSEGWTKIFSGSEKIFDYSENKSEVSTAVDRGAGSELSGDAEEAADTAAVVSVADGRWGWEDVTMWALTAGAMVAGDHGN